MLILFTLAMYLLGYYYFLGIFLKIQRIRYRGYISDNKLLIRSLLKAFCWPIFAIPLLVEITTDKISSLKLADKINKHYDIK